MRAEGDVVHGRDTAVTLSDADVRAPCMFTERCVFPSHTPRVSRMTKQGAADVASDLVQPQEVARVARNARLCVAESGPVGFARR